MRRVKSTITRRDPVSLTRDATDEEFIEYVNRSMNSKDSKSKPHRLSKEVSSVEIEIVDHLHDIRLELRRIADALETLVKRETCENTYSRRY